MIINYIKISKLFGRYDIEVDMRDKCTVLLGANGIGKSTVLNIIKALSDNDFLYISQFNFEELCLGYYVHNRITGEYTTEFKTILLSDLFLDITKFIDSYCTEVIRVGFRYTKKHEFRETFWKEFSKQMKVMLEELIKTHKINRFFYQCAVNEEFDSSIYKIISKFNVDEGDEHLKLFCSMVEAKVYDAGDSKCYYDSSIRKIIDEWKKNKDFAKAYVKKSLYYFDLVKGFSFINQNEKKSIYHSKVLEWIEASRNIYEDSPYSEVIHSYDNFCDNMQVIFNYPRRLLLSTENRFRKFIKDIFRNVDDFSSEFSEKKSAIGGNYHISTNPGIKALEYFIEHREIDINKLIKERYYKKGVIKRANKLIAEYCADLLEDDNQLWMLDGDVYISISIAEKWFPDEVNEKGMNYMLFLKKIFMDEEFKSDFYHYMIPGVCNGLPFPIEKIEKIFAEGVDGVTIDQLTVMSYYFEIYNITINIFKNRENINSEILCLQKIIATYLSNKSVNIYPSGMEIISQDMYQQELYERVEDFNLMASGEKKLILLFTLLILSPGVTVLLDEPELSLSIVWQENLIEDLLQNTELRNITIATHSPYLISKHELEKYLHFLPQES